MTYHDVYTDTYGAAMALTLGIDVSSYQDPSGSGDRNLIDWGQVAPTPYDFALARMSIGRGTVDEDGRQNLKAMLGRIPVPGAYGVVGVSEPVEDGAKLLVREIEACGVDPRTILVMLDAEKFNDGSRPSLRQINRYAIQLHDLLGTWPHAYVPDWFLDQLRLAGDGDGTVRGLELANCLWVPSEYIGAPWTEARISSKKPTNLRGFAGLAWHQFTSSGTVPGITGRVDLDAYYGTLTELRAQLLGLEAPMPTLEEIAELFTKPGSEVRIAIRDLGVRAVNSAIGGVDKADTSSDSPARQGIADVVGALPITLDVTKLTPAQLELIGSVFVGKAVITGIRVSPDGTFTVAFEPAA